LRREGGLALRKKILLSLFFLLIFSTVLVFAQTEYKVIDVIVKGNAKISTQEILKIAGIEKNTYISDDKLNAVKEKLEDSSYFISVVINKISQKDGVVLEINVVESPFLIFVNGIRFQGLQKLSLKDIQDLIILPYVGWTTDQLIWEQRRKFMSTGYFSDINVDQQKIDSGLILVFYFKENPILDSIQINGLKRISKERVLELLGLKEGILISEESILEKKEALINSNLFSDVDFKIEKKDNKLSLVINLKENPLLSQISISGLNKLEMKDLIEVIGFKGDIKGNYIFLNTEIYLSQVLLDNLKSKLEDTGYFKEIFFKTTNLENSTAEININLKENPWIVLVDVKGLKNVSKDKFFNIIKKTSKDFLSDKYIEEKKNLLLNSGYFSSVDIKYVVSPNNMAYVTFIVKENPILDSINYKGISKVTESEVDKYRIINKGDFITQDKIDEQVSKFKDLGYFEEVNVESVTNEDKISLTFIFKENPIVNKISFVGLTGVSIDSLNTILLTKEGKPFNPDFVKKDIINIQNFLQQKGYVFTALQSFSFTEDGELIFTFKEYKVEDIGVEIVPATETSVLGFLAVLRGPTDKNVVKREISLKVGEPVNWEKIKRDLQNIYNVGIFEDVSVRFEQGSSEEMVKVIYVAKEKLSGSFNFGGGYATDVGIYGFVEYKEGNLFGKAKSLSLQLSLTGFGKINYQLSFSDPWFMGGRNSFQLDIYDKKTTITGLTTPTVGKTGGAFSFSYPLGGLWSLSLGFKYEEITYLDNSNPKSSVGSFKIGLIRDSRDFYLNPTQGNRQYVNLEFAGGGSDANFIKYVGDFQWHIPLTNRESTLTIMEQKNRQVLSFRLGLGYAEGNIPTTELFTLGGSSSIRGFYDNEFKGDTFALLNIQYRIPLGNGIYGVFFLDTGNAWYSRDISSLSDIKLYTGMGLGLRYETIIIPIRFDFGYNFGNDPMDPNTKWRIHFSFGDIF